MHESLDDLFPNFIDPRDAYLDDDGAYWPPLAAGGRSAALAAPDLAGLRDECRRLAATNEFAINGHENRISYVVGAGHSYHVTPRAGQSPPAGLTAAVERLIERFCEQNRWHARQQEVVRRLDRDGEALLRTFVDRQGDTLVRFVEPEDVAAPSERLLDPDASIGVQTSPGDVEGVVGYWIGGRLVPAGEVQHRKANVDANVKRGVPLFAPVRKNLRRAEKLLRNMSALAEVQSAIALIRRHPHATRAGVERFVADNTAGAGPDAMGRTRRLAMYGPGTILDAPAGLEYDFPAAAVDAASYVAILQAELRAIAARLLMPEFMLSSDASNANYASTMVAEGPAVRMFQRLQAAMIEEDRALLWRVVENAVQAGRLPAAARRLVDIQIVAPTLELRDPLKAAHADRIAYDHGVLSLQTWSQRLGLDYEQEQKNRREAMNDE
ncbi:Phage portal protein, lambda family [Pirellulimonas nuda]|uniref:Phage portal protein, lambda family n=1 Tax=Pirellulimonas nuda TaxID=2528009 RepID=A0A518D650_9BACT|nr:phage portal protein [Pirellulimonas nuda]QDU86948.1 Phage portal protein, lambda family [Pirellulimonas nuda]